MNVVIRLSRADGDVFCQDCGVKLVELCPDGPRPWSDVMGRRVGTGVGEAARAVDVTYGQGMPVSGKPRRFRIEGWAMVPDDPEAWWTGLWTSPRRTHSLVRFPIASPIVSLPANREVPRVEVKGRGERPPGLRIWQVADRPM
jgi:hypothetical protein